MQTTKRRSAALIVALATLLIVNVTPASALTLQRSWTAKVGTAALYGKVNIKGFTNGVGQINFNLKGLRKNSTYSVQLRTGSCTNPGTIGTKVNVTTSSTGTVVSSRTVLPWQMSAIWSTARKKTFIVRIVRGTSVRCGKFTFVKATRVVVGSLNINLAVIRDPGSYPKCKVAMYSAAVAQPREPGTTFIYAHARTGMFLPLLTKFRAYGAAGLIGRVVKVYTSDSYVSYYKIVSAKKTQDSFNGAFALDRERLRLQTSTGPNYTYPKLIADAIRYKTIKTTYAASHPTPHPVSC